jgi:hypothetical protein
VPVPYANRGILVPSLRVARGSGLVVMMSCETVRTWVQVVGLRWSRS